MNNIKSKYGLIELSSQIAVPDRLNNQVIRSKKNRGKLQCLVKDKTKPEVTDFIQQCGVNNATLRNLSLKEIFVFITRDMV